MAKLSDICELVNQKIKINVAINNNLCNKYISTENMLPNKQGISVASNIPPSGSVTLYRKMIHLFLIFARILKKYG